MYSFKLRHNHAHKLNCHSRKPVSGYVYYNDITANQNTTWQARDHQSSAAKHTRPIDPRCQEAGLRAWAGFANGFLHFGGNGLAGWSLGSLWLWSRASDWGCRLDGRFLLLSTAKIGLVLKVVGLCGVWDRAMVYAVIVELGRIRKQSWVGIVVLLQLLSNVHNNNLRIDNNNAIRQV